MRWLVSKKQGLGVLSGPRTQLLPENSVSQGCGAGGQEAGTRAGEAVLSSGGLRGRVPAPSGSTLGHRVPHVPLYLAPARHPARSTGLALGPGGPALKKSTGAGV